MEEYKKVILKHYKSQLLDFEQEYYFQVFDPFQVSNLNFVNYGTKWDIYFEPKNFNPNFKLNSVGLKKENHELLLKDLFQKAIQIVGRKKCVNGLLFNLTTYWTRENWKDASIFDLENEIDANFLNGKPLLYPTKEEMQEFIDQQDLNLDSE